MSTARRHRRSWRPTSRMGASPPSPDTGTVANLLSGIVERLSGADDWWASALDGGVERWTEELEERYRRLYEREDWDGDDVPYEEAQVAYRVGRIAADHPEHGSSGFDGLARVLEEGWSGEGPSFERVRRYVELGFQRRRFSVGLLRIRERVEELEERWRGRGE